MLIGDVRRVLDRSPEDAGALGHRGYALRKLGRFQPAVADYTAALAQQPGSIRLRNNRGYCLARLGCYADAVADYDAVLDLDASNTHALHNRYASVPPAQLLPMAMLRDDFLKQWAGNGMACT